MNHIIRELIMAFLLLAESCIKVSPIDKLWNVSNTSSGFVDMNRNGVYYHE